ncbi:MAG: hypothetical protein FRX48_06718 [Lasallia pustulata]|uniref:Uncharacterized protein n=1 Tax=Lasallia pustulata TaxID=136370 RepID=A0A5M8PJK1_9LECA|nr:MAG: hypothetical protein FRX48_06718 [Lasallia pustulata]
MTPNEPHSEDLAQHPLHLLRLLFPPSPRRRLHPHLILPKPPLQPPPPFSSAPFPPAIFPSLLLLRRLHPRLLQIPQKLPPLPSPPPHLHPQPLLPPPLLLPHLRHQIPPLKPAQIPRIPQIIMIPTPLLPPDNPPVDRRRAHLRRAFRPELHPPVRERAFLVAARRHPPLVRRRRLRRQEDFADAPVPAEEVSDGLRAHEGRDAREVQHAGFAGGALGGGEVGGGEGFEGFGAGCCGGGGGEAAIEVGATRAAELVLSSWSTSETPSSAPSSSSSELGWSFRRFKACLLLPFASSAASES